MCTFYVFIFLRRRVQIACLITMNTVKVQNVSIRNVVRMENMAMNTFYGIWNETPEWRIFPIA